MEGGERRKKQLRRDGERDWMENGGEKRRKREAREEASKMISSSATGVPPKIYLINYLLLRTR